MGWSNSVISQQLLPVWSMLDTECGCQMEPFNVQPVLAHAAFATLSPVQEYAERKDKRRIQIREEFQCNRKMKVLSMIINEFQEVGPVGHGARIRRRTDAGFTTHFLFFFLFWRDQSKIYSFRSHMAHVWSVCVLTEFISESQSSSGADARPTNFPRLQIIQLTTILSMGLHMVSTGNIWP